MTKIEGTKFELEINVDELILRLDNLHKSLKNAKKSERDLQLLVGEKRAASNMTYCFYFFATGTPNSYYYYITTILADHDSNENKAKIDVEFKILTLTYPEIGSGSKEEYERRVEGIIQDILSRELVYGTRYKFQCPSCKARYTFKENPCDEEGFAICQNCGKHVSDSVEKIEVVEGTLH